MTSIAAPGSTPALVHGLIPRFGMVGATVLAAAAFLAVFGVLIGELPSLGNLAANVAHSDQFGYARAATETPQPIVNILSRPLVISGKTIAPGQIVYPGFDADVLWKFRWYSIINQLLIWTVTGLVFGALLERFLTPPPKAATGPAVREPALS